jgi:excisionase family DNA binding protein
MLALMSRLTSPVVNDTAFRKTSQVSRMLTADEVAVDLHLHVRTVYRLIERGELAHVSVASTTRVLRSDLDDFIQKNRSAKDHAVRRSLRANAKKKAKK